MFIDNRPEFISVLLALQRLGAIAVPVGVREQRPGLAYIAQQCGAAAIVVDAALADRLPDAPRRARAAPAHRRRRSAGAAGRWCRSSACTHGRRPAGPPAAARRNTTSR